VLLNAVVCWAIVVPPRKTNARQHARDHQADHRQPQRMRQPHHAPEQVAHGVEGDAEQDAGKYQKQGCGELPGEREQGGEQHDADAADRYRPRQIVAGLKAIVSRTCHVDSFSQNIAPPVIRQNRAGIKRAERAGLTLPHPVCQAV
jgi:hypothetical protein